MFRNYSKYEVYPNGKIWSYSHKKWLKPQTRPNGYQQVHLSDNEGKRKWYYLHRVVYEAVTGNPIPKGMQINHRNEIKTSNMITNLELMTPKENLNYGSRNEKASKAQSKQVGAFNKNGELVMLFNSMAEARRQGFSQGNISECCNGKRKTHKGYSWRYI